MTPKFREELDLIFPLADALQMRLDVRGRVSGTRLMGDGEFWMELGAVKILLRPKVRASTVTTECAAVLVKVQKRLWMYMAFLKASDSLYLSIIDANAVGLTESNCGEFDLRDPHKSFKLLLPGTVGNYMRSRKGSSWMETSYVDPLDQGRGELPQKEPRPVGTPV